MAKRAILLLAEGFEEIEAVTSMDILRRAEVELTICSIGGKLVTGAHEIKVMADKRLEEYEGVPDAIVLPGGMPGAQNLADSAVVNDLIRKVNEARGIVAAICASPAVVLAPTGMLDGKRATAYPGMEGRFGKDTKFTEERVVVDGNIITGRGPATALEFALAVAKALAGGDIADNLKKKTLMV